MSYEDINNKLDQLNMEDAIWVIYIGIICLSWYSNILEKNYFIYNDNESKEEYRKIMVLIFGVLVIIYFYFLKSAVDDINKIRANDSKERKKLLYLSFIGSLLITISGIIFLYIALNDNDINVEIAFN